MYSRRPKKRAADVARQAGRQWYRMTDQQKSRYRLKHNDNQEVDKIEVPAAMPVENPVPVPETEDSPKIESKFSKLLS